MLVRRTIPASLGTPCGHTFCVQCLIGAWASVVINVRRIDEHFENDPPSPFKRMKCPECRAEVPDNLPSRRVPRDLATFPFTLHPAMQRQIEKTFDRVYVLLKEANLPPSHPLMEKYNMSEGNAASPAQRQLLIRWVNGIFESMRLATNGKFMLTICSSFSSLTQTSRTYVADIPTGLACVQADANAAEH